MKCNDIPEFDFIMGHGSLFEYYYLIYAKFNFWKYKEERRNQLPEWSERKIECVLYYQGSIKKRLKEFIEVLHKNNKSNFYVFGCGSGFSLSFQKIVYSMEATTINVFSTMKLNGINLEIKPMKWIHFVCLICTQNPLNFNKEKKITLEAYL